MPDLQLLITFFASAAVFAYAPGPSTLYAAAQTIAGGEIKDYKRRSEFMSVVTFMWPS